MADIAVGVLAVLAGITLCFFGYWTLRIVLSVWGAVIGFGLGSSLATWINDDSYLASAVGWIIGFILALIFAALAYLYYEIGVVLSFASMGFALGTAAMVAVGVQWNWVIVTVGVVIGIVVAMVALLADVPRFLLLVVSTFAGASIVVTGLMLLTGAIDTADFDSIAVTEDVNGNLWWALAFVVVAVAGFVFQLRRTTLTGGMREGWGPAPAGRPAG